MYSCLRQNCSLPKKLFFYRRSSSSKFFSVLFSLHDKPSVNYHASRMFFKNINKPKQIRYRYFSQNYGNSFFESLRSSEAAKIVKYALIEIHDISGLPWSYTIIAASAAIKLFISFPCGIYQQYLASKLDLINEVELVKAAKKIKEAKVKEAYRHQWTNEKLQLEYRVEVSQMWKILVVKNNCHPFKITVLFFIQLPFWLLLIVVMRSLVLDVHSKIKENHLAALQLQVGGPFWCSDLSVPDPKFILPTISALCMLTNTELSLLSRKQTQYYKNFLGNKIISYFLRAFSVVFFFVASMSPAAVSLFWASNGVFALGQNLLLMSPRVRRFFKIPKTFSEVDKPYSYALNNFVKKWENVFKQKK